MRAAAPVPSRPHAGHAPLGRLAGLVVAALALTSVLWAHAARPAAAAGTATAPTAGDFAGVVRAWTSRDAAGVAAYIPAEGRIPVSLRGGGTVAGIRQSVTRANGAQVLKQYFEGVDKIALKDLGSGRNRTDTRTFEYAYRPKGADPVVSRLVLRLAPLSSGGYALTGIDEP